MLNNKTTKAKSQNHQSTQSTPTTQNIQNTSQQIKSKRPNKHQTSKPTSIVKHKHQITTNPK